MFGVAIEAYGKETQREQPDAIAPSEGKKECLQSAFWGAAAGAVAVPTRCRRGVPVAILVLCCWDTFPQR